MVDLKLPISWQDKYVLKERGDKIQMKINNNNETSKIVSFFAMFDEEGTKLLLDEIQAIIKFNKDIVEKDNLLKMRMSELEKTFSENNIDSLRNLEFNFTTNLQLNGKEETETLVREGTLKGPSGSITA